MHFERADGSKAQKIVFFNYVPDLYTGMDKLFYSGAKDFLQKEFEGIARTIQVRLPIFYEKYRLTTKTTSTRRKLLSCSTKYVKGSCLRPDSAFCL